MTEPEKVLVCKCRHADIGSTSSRTKCEDTGRNSARQAGAMHAPRLAFFTTYFGPRTACAGFDGVICRTTWKSYKVRTKRRLWCLRSHRWPRTRARRVLGACQTKVLRCSQTQSQR